MEAREFLKKVVINPTGNRIEFSYKEDFLEEGDIRKEASLIIKSSFVTKIEIYEISERFKLSGEIININELIQSVL